MAVVSILAYTLYHGAPRGTTPYEFWFDTSVDPVEYYDDQKKDIPFGTSLKEMIMAQSVLDEIKFIHYTEECNSTMSLKGKFSIYTKYMIGNNTSEDILNTKKMFIQKWIHTKDQNHTSN